MANISIKLKFRPSSVEGKEGTLRYRIIKNRKVNWIGTEYHIMPSEWDDVEDKIILPSASTPRHAIVSQIKANIEWELKCLQMLASKGNNEYDVEKLIEDFRDQQNNRSSVFMYMQNRANSLNLLGKTRSSKACLQALSRFMRFRKDIDLLFTQIDSQMIQMFEAELKRDELEKNTISFYMRQLRVCYNLAVEDGLTEDKRPFKRVFTGVEKTIKRAIPYSAIVKIAKLDLSNKPSLDFARDIFMFSFLTRGMSFIDMAYLKKSDIKDNRIIYRRKKTGQKLEIGWEKQMVRIVEKYSANNNGQYLLPIITNNDVAVAIQCKNKLQQINRNLKKISKMLNLNVNLTTYVARHSWASAARDMDVSLSVISEGLGHEDIKTTQIYLSDINTATIDKANQMIIKEL